MQFLVLWHCGPLLIVFIIVFNTFTTVTGFALDAASVPHTVHEFLNVKLFSQEMETDKNEDDEKKKKKRKEFLVFYLYLDW